MSKMMNLIKRNCLVFLKDKGAVFFSLLSMLIVLVLMGVFLGEMNVESVTELLEQYGGERDLAQDTENAKQLVNYWTLAGLMVVNALTVSLMVIGTMVTDKAGEKLKSFYTAPISKFMVAVSYIAAAVLIGVFFCMLTFLGYMLYILYIGGTVLSVGAILKVLGYTLLNVVVFSVMMYLLALFVKTSGAWGGIGTFVGTLVGFLGAIYVPVGSLPEGVAGVLKCLPILHSTSLMRKVMCEEAMAAAFTNVPAEVIDIYRDVMGIDIVVNSEALSDELQMLFLVICGMITLVAIAFVARKRKSL